MSNISELYWRKVFRGLENFENLRNGGHNTINTQGISLDECKLKLLTEERTEF